MRVYAYTIGRTLEQPLSYFYYNCFRRLSCIVSTKQCMNVRIFAFATNGLAKAA